MAKQQYYAASDFRYGTRMLTAGDPVGMTAPVARLYRALGKVTLEKPKKAPVREESLTEPKPEPKKAPARKRKAAAKK